MAGPVTLTCPRCRQVFPVPTEVLRVDGHHVIVRMDRSGLYDHPCVETAADAPRVALMPAGPSKAELAGRIGQFLDGRHYLATGGSRACTMCGANGHDCLTALGKTRTACCAGCHNGNTHPAPGEAQGSCQQWAEAREAQQ